SRGKDFLTFVEQASTKLPDFDFQSFRIEAEAFVTGNYDAVIEKLKLQIEEGKKQRRPVGYSEMKLAVLRAQKQSNLAESETILLEVHLSQNDFRWLEDIRLLCRCELAN